MKTIPPDQVRNESLPELKTRAEHEQLAPTFMTLATAIRARMAERAKRRRALIEPNESAK